MGRAPAEAWRGGPCSPQPFGFCLACILCPTLLLLQGPQSLALGPPEHTHLETLHFSTSPNKVPAAGSRAWDINTSLLGPPFHLLQEGWPQDPVVLEPDTRILSLIPRKLLSCGSQT